MSPESSILLALGNLIDSGWAAALRELEAEDGTSYLPLEKEARTPTQRRLPEVRLRLRGAERTEKDRLVRNERYQVEVTVSLAKGAPGAGCYFYAQALSRALARDPTLGGTATVALITQKDYRHASASGEPYQAILTVTVVKEVA